MVTAAKPRTTADLIAHAVKHPTRIEALAILNERVASPSDIAAIIGEGVSKVAHHVSELHKGGCIEIVRTGQVRGATEHFYRASLRPNISDDEWAKLSPTSRTELSGLVFQAIVAEGLGAIRANTFDSRVNRHLSWKVVNVDEQGFDELAEDKAESLERVAQIEAKAAARMVRSGRTGFSAIVAGLLFERAKPGRSPRAAIGG